MSKIQSDPLKVLDRIYRFPGGNRGTQEVDLARPVTIVHDVGQQAAFDSQVGIQATFSQVTAGGAASVTSTWSVEDDLFGGALYQETLKNLGLTFRNSDVWLVNVDAYLTGGPTRINHVTAGFQLPRHDRFISPAGTTGIQMCFLANIADTAGQWQADNATRFGLFYQWQGGIGDAAPAARPSGVPLPQRCRELYFRSQDNGLGALTTFWQFHLHVCPRGTRPLIFT